MAELRDKLQLARAAVITDYRGLKVAEITELRQRLRDAGVEYRVIKNTLARLAAQHTDASSLTDHFNGPCALALSFDDEVIPAKVLMDFARTNSKLEIKAGVLSGRLLGAEELKKVTSLPTKEELQAQLLGLMALLPARFLGVLSAVPRDFLNVLTATPRNLMGLLKALEQKGSQAS